MTQAVRLEIPLVLPGVRYGDACIRRLTSVLASRQGVETVHVIAPGESATADRVHMPARPPATRAPGPSRGTICVHIDTRRVSLTAVVDSALATAASLTQSFGHATFALPTGCADPRVPSIEAGLALVDGVTDVKLDCPESVLRVEYDRRRLEDAVLLSRARLLGVTEMTRYPVAAGSTAPAPRGGMARWLRRLVGLVVLMGVTVSISGCSNQEEHEGKPMSYWVSQITSSDSVRRHAAAAAFAHDAAHSPEAARALLEVLATEREADVHATVAEALGSLGSEGARAVPELIRLLGDEHDVVRERAASALGSVGGSSPAVVDALTKALGDADHDVRASATEALAKIGSPAARSAPALLQVAESDRIGWVRLQAVRALGSVGEPTDEARAFLVKSAETDEWPSMREGALNALALHSHAARAAIATIRRAARDTNFDVRNAAARGLIAAGATP